MKRCIDHKSVLIFDGEEKVISYEEFNRENGVDGIIRFHPEDFEKISGKFMHFNLEKSKHEKGKVYALMKILRPGFFDGEKEALPLLDIHFKKALCTGAENHVSYEELEHIDLSLSFEKTVENVKNVILKRYNQSMPHVSEEEKLKLGVGITYLDSNI